MSEIGFGVSLQFELQANKFRGDDYDDVNIYSKRSSNQFTVHFLWENCIVSFRRIGKCQFKLNCQNTRVLFR